MPNGSRPPLSERLHLDDPAVLRAVAWSLPFSTLVAGLALVSTWKLGPPVALAAALAGFCGSVAFVGGGALLLAHLTARAGASVLLPNGRSTPGVQDFSREKALVARGELDEALRLLRSRLAREPENAALHLYAADVYAREARDPRRGEALFRRARQLRRVTAGEDLYATNRLIDLYLGVLESPERAAEELRRIVERHPTSREAAHARELLRSLP